MKFKVFITILFVGLLLVVQRAEMRAQGTKTIVLVRHAEKDVSPTADKADPKLTPEGRERAHRLLLAVKKYKPHEIFSTDYKRTRDTVEPIAKYRKKSIQIYDAAKPNELVAKIMTSKTDHYLIVGHSNTIPPLANLLVKKEIFRNLLDPEHSVIWVIRMKKGTVTKIEILSY